MKKAAGLLALSFLFLPVLHAEAFIESMHWQRAQPADGQPLQYRAIHDLTIAGARIEGRLRVRVVIKNRGDEDAEGIVLLYGLTARLAPLRGREPGVWAVPFATDVKRVPKIAPHQSVEVFIDPARSTDLPLSRYLQRANRAGLRTDRLKLQAMLFPRPDVVKSVRMLQRELPVSEAKESEQ